MRALHGEKVGGHSVGRALSVGGHSGAWHSIGRALGRVCTQAEGTQSQRPFHPKTCLSITAVTILSQYLSIHHKKNQTE